MKTAHYVEAVWLIGFWLMFGGLIGAGAMAAIYFGYYRPGEKEVGGLL